MGLGFFGQGYARYGLIAPTPLLSRPGGSYGSSTGSGLVPAAAFSFVLLLFPSGQLPSRRWRPAAWFVAAVYALQAIGIVARASRVWRDPFAPQSQGWYPGLHSALARPVAGRYGRRRRRADHQVCPVVRRGAAAAEVVRVGRCARRGHDHPARGGTADLVAPSHRCAAGSSAQSAVLPSPGVPVCSHRRGDPEVQALRDRHSDQQGASSTARSRSSSQPSTPGSWLASAR